MSLNELSEELKKASLAIDTFCKDSLEMSAQSLADKYVKEHELEYMEEEIKDAFRAGFRTYRRQLEAGKFKR